MTPAEAVERIKLTRAAEETRRENARVLAERERALKVSRPTPGQNGPSLSW